ncbi:alpha/beta fold hydrolase [Methylocystis sp. Sn-Cys]|uniref:thioesterase II family protein n=1 Tax=Methylocystis sp. Sn-Cys TaxID=1701263 RepID=UPI001920C0F0|nr:thioesterase [Methylocystis sp. Sn-Cys]
MFERDRRPLSLYCFPCAGGSANSFLRWRPSLPPWIRIRPVELPGRGVKIREPLLRDFDAVVENLTQELVRESSDRCVFFGHSLGALIAYRCVHALRTRGKGEPMALIAACSAAPSRRRDERLARLKTDADLIGELVRLNGTPPELFTASTRVGYARRRFCRLFELFLQEARKTLSRYRCFGRARRYD